MKKEASAQNNVERGNTGLALKAGFWYVASTFLLKSIAFITIPIFSRLLSKSDYGEFSNYANWQATLLIITGAELYSSISRAYYDFREDFDKYVSSVAGLSVLITAGVYGLFLLNSSWIFNLVKIPPQFVHILFFTLMCNAGKTLFLTRERTLYRYRSVAAISAADTLIPTTIAILLVSAAASSSRLAARIYGFYLPSSAIGFTCICILMAKGRTIRPEHWKYALTLSLPLLVHYLTINLLTSTNTIIAKNLGGAELSAEVSMATSVIHILTILFQSLSGALTTWLMDNLNQKKMGKIRKESLVYVGGLVAVSMGIILLAPEVLIVLGGTRYVSAAPLIPGLVLAAFIQTMTTILTIILTYDKNVVKTAVFAGIGAVVSIAAKVFFFPRYGAACLPMVNVAVCGVLFAVNYLLVVRAGYKEAVDAGKYLIALCIVLAGTLGSAFLYSHAVIRYAIIGAAALCVLTALFVFRKKIAELLKKRKKKQ